MEKMSTHEKLTAKRSYTTVHLFEKDILLNTEVFKCKCRFLSFLLPERNNASIIFALSFNVFLLNETFFVGKYPSVLSTSIFLFPIKCIFSLISKKKKKKEITKRGRAVIDFIASFFSRQIALKGKIDKRGAISTLILITKCLIMVQKDKLFISVRFYRLIHMSDFTFSFFYYKSINLSINLNIFSSFFNF